MMIMNPRPFGFHVASKLTSIFPLVTLLFSYYGLTGADIRLIGYASEYEGIVEIMYQGVWGTICDDGWDDNDATVVCRELGFLDGIAIQPFSEFNSGPVWLRQVECLGNESKLSLCPHSGIGSIGNCTHVQDVGVECNVIKVEPIVNGTLRLTGSDSPYEGRVEVFINGQWGAVCDDEWDDSVASVVCKQLGIGSLGIAQQSQFSGSGEVIEIPTFSCSGNESTLLSCSNRGMEMSSCNDSDRVEIICTGPTPALPIRLADGVSPFSGRVEIYHNGMWSTVCDKNWTDSNTEVVCSQLGYKYYRAITDNIVPAGKGPILLDDVKCSGNETNLLACSHSGFGNHNCGHVEDVGVTCLLVDQYPSIRLVGGSSYNEGRVEVNYNDGWGTVCDDGWDDTDAGVVCRQLGFGSSGLAVYSSSFGEGSGPIWLDNVMCTGNEPIFANCGHLGINILRSCDHSTDAAVRCLGGQGIPIRLVGGSSYNEGRVEVNYNGEWGTVCDDGWDDTDAGVVCRQLGFGSSGAAIGSAGFGQGSGSILLSNVDCTGDELLLASCGHFGINITSQFSCTHVKDAGVRCDDNATGSLIRLVGGSSYNEGRVEVNYNGEWGTVCDDGWDDTDASVVCKQLGFGSSGTAIGSAGFGQGSGSIWLDSVMCNGSESTLASCGHLGVNITRNCRHSKDVGVRCRGDEPLIRLVGGSSYNEGRVEVNYNGEWGTVCDDGWDDTDAGVVCRQLGLGSSGTAIGSSEAVTGSGQGSGLIWLDRVQCTGNELTLARCAHLGVGITGNCSHSNNAAVRCSGDAKPIIHVHPMDRVVEISNISTSIVLTCMAYGAESYYWLKDNQLQKISPNTVDNMTGNLVLVNLMPSDAGRYQCVAKNSYGEIVSDYAKLTINIVPPLVTILPELTNASKGGSAEFSCTATGVGAADFEYQWFLNQRLISLQNTPTLIVNDITSADSGDYTCSVRSPYKGIGNSGVARLFISSQSCQSETVSYQGFDITWNGTLAGDTVEALCKGRGLNGLVRRRCIRDDEWEENNGCYREEAKMLFILAMDLTLLTNASSRNDTITKASGIASMLADFTAPSSGPLYAQEIDLAVTIVSSLNNVTAAALVETGLAVNSTYFEDTAKILDNLLSDTNQENWEQLERTSPSTSQAFVSGVEQFAKLLSKTLTNDTTEIIMAKPNIVIKAECLSKEDVSKDYSFPDEDDSLASYEGKSAHLMIPSSILENTFTAGSMPLTITSSVIKNGYILRLPTIDNGTGSPPVPASSIFSLQMSPVPDSATLESSPIMMMFDVQPPPLITSSEEHSHNSDFTLQDVTCNFYDYTLTTNNFNQAGGWSTEGLTVDKSQSSKESVTCLTTHLTSFAVLVSIQDTAEPSTPDDKALSIISYIGCSISLICLCVSIIILTIVILKTREKINYLFIHLNLCIALALGLIVFVAGIENAVDHDISCKAAAALLQYFFISAFCWMLCEGVMLFMMLVTVFGSRFNRRRFFFVLGWGPAIPIVAISLGLAHEHYGTDHYCWIRSDKGAVAAFIAPIVAIILINCIFLVISLKVVWRSKQTASNANKLDTVKDLAKAMVILLPVLGLTWIIGILAVNNDTKVFAWIFAILNSLQGVFIFIFHVLRSKQITKEIRLQYHIMRHRKSFRNLHLERASGKNIYTSTTESTLKGKTSGSKPSDSGIQFSTTSAGSCTAILSKTTIEDAVFKDDDQIDLKTFKILEEPITKDDDTDNKKIDAVKENHVVDTVEKKSITEEDTSMIIAEKEAPTTEPDPLPSNET